MHFIIIIILGNIFSLPLKVIQVLISKSDDRNTGSAITEGRPVSVGKTIPKFSISNADIAQVYGDTSPLQRYPINYYQDDNVCEANPLVQVIRKSRMIPPLPLCDRCTQILLFLLMNKR